MLNRMSYGYQSKRKSDTELIEMINLIAASHPRWGFRKIYDWLRFQGYKSNHKKVRRLYCELKLNHRIKPKKRLPSRSPEPLTVPMGLNESWSMDFMSDDLDTGRKYRTLNVIDDCNREVVAIEADYSLPSIRVIRVLEQIVEERGYPKQIRVDNGPEFIATRLSYWAETHGVKLEHIKPGKPAQNAYIERFNRTFREDILDMYLFNSLDQVRELSANWMIDYNENRPHKALGGIPPRAFASTLNSLVLTGI